MRVYKSRSRLTIDAYLPLQQPLQACELSGKYGKLWVDNNYWSAIIRHNYESRFSRGCSPDMARPNWPPLQRYATSGSLPIDNNPVENAMRPIAIGKKEWLLAGSGCRPPCCRHPEPVRNREAQRP